MKLSPHFHLSEFLVSQEAARRGIDNTPPPEVVEALKSTAVRMEAVRSLLGHPISINSGYRSKRLNKAIGGAVNSAHMTGHAVDFICPAFGSPLDICRKIVFSAIKFDQIIEEGTWVHISFDPRMREQVLTKDPAGGYRQGLK